MANFKLPYEDEQDLDKLASQDSSQQEDSNLDENDMALQSLIEDSQLNNTQSIPVPTVDQVRAKYFAPKVPDSIKNGDQSMVGKVVGKKMNKSSDDDEYSLDEIASQVDPIKKDTLKEVVSREPASKLDNSESQSERDPFQKPQYIQDAEDAANAKSELDTQQPQMSLVTPEIKDSVPVSPKSSRESLLQEYNRLMDEKQNRVQQLDMQQGLNQMVQGVASGGGAKIGDNSDYIKSAKETAGLPIEKFLGKGKITDLQNQIEINDPNSDISGFAREQSFAVMKKLNPKMSSEEMDALKSKFDSMSAKQLEQLGFKFGTGGDADYKARMLAIYEGRNQINSQRVEQGQSNLDLNKDKFTNKKGEHLGKLQTDFNKSLDVMKFTKNSQIGRDVFSLGAANQIQMIYNSNPKGDFNHMQVEELANIGNRMLTQGSTSARAGIEGLLVRTGQSDFTKLKDYVFNNPHSVGAGDFMKTIKKMADREKEISSANIKKYMISQSPAAKELALKDPDSFNSILSSKVGLLDSVNASPDQSKSELSEKGINATIPNAEKVIKDSSPTDLVTIQGPSGTIVKMEKSKAEKYLNKPGYKLVGQ